LNKHKLFKLLKKEESKMPNKLKDVVEITSMNNLERIHQEIIDILIKNDLSIPIAIGIIEIIKNDLMNNPDIFDDDDFDDDDVVK